MWRASRSTQIEARTISPSQVIDNVKLQARMPFLGDPVLANLTCLWLVKETVRMQRVPPIMGCQGALQRIELNV